MSLQTPFIDMLPPLSTEEFEALEADVREHGVRQPVYVDEEDNVLDGHHRLKIDPNAPRKVIRGLSYAEKVAFVFRCNFVRRNLSPDQKAEARRRMKDVAFALREEDKRKWTLKRVASALGVHLDTVSGWFATDSENRNGSRPDARVKVAPERKAEAAERVRAGETHEQVAADLGVSRQAVTKIVGAEEKKAEAERERIARIKAAKARGDVDGFVEGDFREVAERISADTVDLIFTDPPYDKETLPLYGDLARIAAEKLVEGGSLICYLGQYQVDKVLELVTPHLKLLWTLAVIHTGQSARMNYFGIVVKWKPLLWFVKGTNRCDPHTFVDDLVTSTQEKSHHDWQQSMVEASYYIEKLTPAGGLVFDPFCGGGTTPAACKALGRRFITCDVDGDALALAKERAQ